MRGRRAAAQPCSAPSTKGFRGFQLAPVSTSDRRDGPPQPAATPAFQLRRNGKQNLSDATAHPRPGRATGHPPSPGPHAPSRCQQPEPFLGQSPHSSPHRVQCPGVPRGWLVTLWGCGGIVGIWARHRGRGCWGHEGPRWGTARGSGSSPAHVRAHTHTHAYTPRRGHR